MNETPSSSKTLLRIFGILQILLGGGILLSSCATWMITAVMDRLEGTSAAGGSGPLLPLMGLWLLVGGVGLLRGRKWAWVMTLFQDILLIVFGYFSFVWTMEWMPDLLLNAPSASKEAARRLAGSWMQYALTGAIPAAIAALQLTLMLLPGTRALIRSMDPRERWMDRTTLRVLAFSVYLAMCFTMGLGDLFGTDPNADFFGWKLTGSAATAMNALDLGILAYLTVGFFRRERFSYLAIILMNVFWTLSGILTTLNTPLSWHYRNSELGKASLALIPDPVFLSPAVLTLGSVLITTMEFAYLYWIRKDFEKNHP